MAKRNPFQLTEAERRRRHFSEGFKKQKVLDLESGRVTLLELIKQYEVSYHTIYRWKNTYGIMKDKTERIIVETLSDTQQLLALRKKVAELERLVGQKQIQLEFKDKMIELAEETYQVDIKKKFSTTPSTVSGKTG